VMFSGLSGFACAKDAQGSAVSAAMRGRRMGPMTPPAATWIVAAYDTAIAACGSLSHCFGAPRPTRANSLDTGRSPGSRPAASNMRSGHLPHLLAANLRQWHSGSGTNRLQLRGQPRHCTAFPNTCVWSEHVRQNRPEGKRQTRLLRLIWHSSNCIERGKNQDAAHQEWQVSSGLSGHRNAAFLRRQACRVRWLRGEIQPDPPPPLRFNKGPAG
jgi:hypothetical protein